MLLAIWIEAISNDIAVTVDGLGGSERPTGVGRDKAVEVSHYPIAVEEGMIGECFAGRRDPHYLVGVVDVEGVAIRPTKRAQVSHYPITVEEGMSGRIVAHKRKSDHLVSVVDSIGPTPEATERAQVSHNPTTVEKGTRLGIAGIRGPNYLVGVVDVAGKTL